MNDSEALRDFYRDVIVAHDRAPHHYGSLAEATVSVEGRNVSCGDQISLDLRLDGDQIEAAGFSGQGCAISRASASLLCDAITGHNRAEAERRAEAFMAMLRGDEPDDTLGEIAALRGVAHLPGRVKCALLPWQTLLRALSIAGGDPAQPTSLRSAPSARITG